MTHEEVLNRILADTCPIWKNKETGVSEYFISAHSAKFVITARCISGHPTIKFDILEMRNAIPQENDYLLGNTDVINKTQMEKLAGICPKCGKEGKYIGEDLFNSAAPFRYECSCGAEWYDVAKRNK